MHLAYADEGPGPAVVLLHGFPLSRAMWAEQLPAIGCDLSGDRAGPAGPWRIAGSRGRVHDGRDGRRRDRAARTALHITRADRAGGLSMGGYVALSLVARYPERVRALMLMDTQAGADTPEAAQRPRSHRAGRPRGRQRRPSSMPMIAAALQQADAGGTAGAGRAAAGRDGSRPRREGSPGACAAWRCGPTAAATWPRSRFRPWFSWARTT